MPRTCALIAASLLVAARASAQSSPPAAPAAAVAGHWSIITGETVSPDRDAIAFEAGWPGISFSYLHGTSDRSDVALKLDLLYGDENTTTTHLGFGLDVPFRLVVNRSNRVLIGLHIDPGLRIYSRNGATDFMTRFPVGGTVGIQATPEVRVAVSADLTLGINWTHTTYFEFGPQFGLAAEYAPDRNLLFGLDAKFGPQFITLSGTGADLAFVTQVVIGYRM